MTLFAKHGEASVCFGEDGFFHPVENDANGYEVPSEAKLISVGDEWHLADDDSQPHNVQYGSSTLPVEVE